MRINNLSEVSEVSKPRTQEGENKCNGGYKRKKAEEIARKRRDRGWLAARLAPAALGEGASEVVDVEVGVEVKVGFIDVESLETEVVGVAVVIGASVDSVPTVTVRVPDEVDEVARDFGMGIDDIAAASGEAKDPDIPVRLTW